MRAKAGENAGSVVTGVIVGLPASVLGTIGAAGFSNAPVALAVWNHAS